MSKKHRGISESDIVREIQHTLGVKRQAHRLSEAYVTEPKKYSLATEFLSTKSKAARQEDFEHHVKALNEVSAQLDVAPRDTSDKYSSEFRRLKVDEVHCLNAAFLRALHFENISDLRSQITMDSLSFLRIERDFGTFDEWQKDFIACGMASRGGYVVTGYNTFLNRYINFVIDAEALNVPIATHPVIVLDVSEGAYYRDYLNDRKTYIVAMMKELDWNHVEKRFKRAEKIAKVTSKQNLES